jgi:hypothetical protein
MRKMLSHAFSTKALLEQEPLISRNVDTFIHKIGTIKADGGKRGVDITRWFNHVTFDIMGGVAFGDSFGARVGNYGPKSCKFLYINRFRRKLTVENQTINITGFQLSLIVPSSTML